MNKKKPSTEASEALKNTQKDDGPEMPEEFGGFKAQNLPEPTRFKDWEVKGRCSDF